MGQQSLDLDRVNTEGAALPSLPMPHSTRVPHPHDDPEEAVIKSERPKHLERSMSTAVASMSGCGGSMRSAWSKKSSLARSAVTRTGSLSMVGDAVLVTSDDDDDDTPCIDEEPPLHLWMPLRAASQPGIKAGRLAASPVKPLPSLSPRPTSHGAYNIGAHRGQLKPHLISVIDMALGQRHSSPSDPFFLKAPASACTTESEDEGVARVDTQATGSLSLSPKPNISRPTLRSLLNNHSIGRQHNHALQPSSSQPNLLSFGVAQYSTSPSQHLSSLLKSVSGTPPIPHLSRLQARVNGYDWDYMPRSQSTPGADRSDRSVEQMTSTGLPSQVDGWKEPKGGENYGSSDRASGVCNNPQAITDAKRQLNSLEMSGGCPPAPAHHDTSGCTYSHFMRLAATLVERYVLECTHMVRHLNTEAQELGDMADRLQVYMAAAALTLDGPHKLDVEAKVTQLWTDRG